MPGGTRAATLVRVRNLSEPRPDDPDPAALFVSYLDWYRGIAVRKVASLSGDDQRRSRLPSGWTPLELLHHLAYMEQRWFQWGFLGEQVEEPWGDSDGDRWRVPDTLGCEELADFLRSVGERTRAVLTATPLETPAALGGRFVADPPTLGWICFHVLQEYARHAGHLDIAVELAGGDVGE